MTCTITLYKDAKIIPARNFVVDDIETYLATLTKTTISAFQYLRNDLNLTIKINLSQVYTDSNSLYNYNYLKVVQNSITYYYFVIKKTQVAESTIAFELLMDTLNTYKWGSAFTVTNRTRVNREHKNRIIGKLNAIIYSSMTEIESISDGYTSEGYLVLNTSEDQNVLLRVRFRYSFIPPAHYSYQFILLDEYEQIQFYKYRNDTSLVGVKYYDEDYPDGVVAGSSLTLNDAIKNLSEKRNIDYYSEGIYPQLHKRELGNLVHKENSTWNLVYRNDDNDAIACFIIPKNEGLSAKTISSQTLSYTDFEDGKYYEFAPFNGESVIITDNDGKNYKIYVSGANWNVKEVRRSGTTLQIRSLTTLKLSSSNLVTATGSWKTITSLSYNVNSLYYNKLNSSPVNMPTTSNGSFSATATLTALDTLQDVDRVDPKLIKIIEIPYFPSNYTYASVDESISVDSTWTLSSSPYKAFRLNDLNNQFSITITSDIDNPLRVFNFDFALNPSYTDLRNNLYESKIFHSDFYRPKFVYDSFGFNFELEKIDVDNFSPNNKFSFEFVMTSTINSKFLFRFPEYVLKLATEDYDNILSVSRNNEAPIYNSAYITYLRTAYRYDLKALQNQGANKFTNWITNLANLGIDAGLVGATGGAGGIGLARSFISYVKNITSMAIDTQQQNNSLESKMESLRNQANSVSGSDDIDLLNAYSNNRAKLVIYEPTERDRKLLYDLFYYYGYTTNEIKIPSTRTRYWFNFVSCELELNGLDKNITEVCKEDIIKRYSEGATFLHHKNNTWDFAQVKENWETALMPEDYK